MAEWGDFFTAIMGAAAALAGLLMVSVSINLTQILKLPQLPGRAAEALIIMGGAMLAAGIGLIPNQRHAILGAEIMVIGAIITMTSVTTQLRSYRMTANPPLNWWLGRALMIPFTGLPLAIGGALMLAGADSGLYWIASGMLLSLVAGIYASWILLIEILR
jgi:modulator of FtsH protease